MCPKENSIKRTYLSQSMETKIRPTNSWTEHALFWDVSSESLIAKVRLRSSEEQKLLTSHQYRPWWTGNRIHSHIVCMLSASADGPLLQISGAERGHSDIMPAFVLTKAVPSEGSDSDSSGKPTQMCWWMGENRHHWLVGHFSQIRALLLLWAFMDGIWHSRIVLWS